MCKRIFEKYFFQNSDFENWFRHLNAAWPPFEYLILEMKKEFKDPDQRCSFKEWKFPFNERIQGSGFTIAVTQFYRMLLLRIYGHIKVNILVKARYKNGGRYMQIRNLAL